MSENQREILHSLYEKCNEMTLNELYQLTEAKDITLEETMFYVAIYNYFLQQEQKKWIN